MTSKPAPVLLWLRRDLRLSDNPALTAALASSHPVVPVFILDDATPGAWAARGAARWWLHHSLSALGADLAARGAPLVLRRGAYAAELARLVEQTGAVAIHTGHPTEPWARRMLDGLAPGLPVHLHRTTLMFGPEEIRTQAGTPFGVYTPFSRACLARGLPPPPLPAPDHILGDAPVASDLLDSWRLLPTAPDWAGGMRASWKPGEAGAHRQLAHFLRHGLAGYGDQRDLPGIDGTSRLSPHLAWGEISAGQIWHAAEAAGGAGRAKFINEVLWREFAAHLLWHHPHLPDQPLRPAFAAMPWRDAPADLLAWQRGQTGVPIVDAGMRQLWQTGWMHNRVRMIVASFLVKHLMLPWQAGEAWFWDTLVDADLAQNAASWQWVAGCGADAAPYYRVFNPLLQGNKFDSDGAYVRRYVPELARLPDQHLHAPWEAPPMLLAQAGIVLGRSYPHPIIDLVVGRERALAAFGAIKGGAA